MRQATDQALPLVMVTGASSGIGKALAMAFAREGHPLLLISRHIEPIAGLPEDTVYRQADVADYGAITAAVKAKLTAARFSNIVNVDVNTTNGIVTLAGEVPNPQVKADAEREVRTVDGVRGINNNLQVKNPPSP